ncbi:MAG: hypothetical protein ACRCYR_05125 [Phycicoccus sp.]
MPPAFRLLAAAGAGAVLVATTAPVATAHTTSTADGQNATARTVVTAQASARHRERIGTSRAADLPTPTRTVVRGGTLVPAGSIVRTVRVSTPAQLATAVANARPGDAIRLAAGTYTGKVTINRSGTASAPISLAPDGSGPVVLTAPVSMPGCGATGPDGDRTVTFTKGASHWALGGLVIRGGVLISSKNAGAAQNWFAARIDSGDWQARRSVPGRGSRDPVAARDAIAHLSRLTGQTIVPSDHLVFVGNTVTGKGVMGRATRYGTFVANTITDVACGTGPGLWLSTFSDGWTIARNTVSQVASSTASHYMQEGIRLGNSSSYNHIIGNLVTDLPGNGRAVTTDQDASWNVIEHNTARNVDIGFNDQMSGWGNTWQYNSVPSYRTAGLSFRIMDGTEPPSYATSTHRALVRCNSATGPRDLQAGSLIGVRFESNTVDEVVLGASLRTYFGAQGNTWNGSSATPSRVVAPSSAGC